jgi:hypothetical protein
MQLPAGSQGPVAHVPTADGLNVLGGDASNPFYFAQVGPALVQPAQVAGAAITAASETSLLPAAQVKTLPANFFAVGRTLRIRASGLISTVITTPGTLRFKVKLGSVAVFDSLAILPDAAAAHSAKGWDLEILLTCRAVGSGTSANLWGSGKFTSEVVAGSGTMPLGALVAMLPWNSTPAAGSGFDSTATQALDLTFTQTVATGSITLEQYFVELVGG